MIYPEPAADLPAVHSYKTPPVRQIQIAFFHFSQRMFQTDNIFRHATKELIQ